MNAIIRIVDENQYTGIATVDNTLKELESKVIASYGNVKEQAIACMNLKNAMDSCEKFNKVKFPKFIDNRFNGAIKGATAYKYAQTASIFSDFSDIWDMFNMGQMVELIALYEKDGKNGYKPRKDCSFDDMCIYAGKELDKITEDTYCNWEIKNATALSQIKALKEMCVPYDNIVTTPEPAKSLARVYDEKVMQAREEHALNADALEESIACIDTWFVDNMKEIGYQWLLDCTTKGLREFVSMYLDSKGIKKVEKSNKSEKENKPDSGTTEPTETTEPTTEEIKATALKSLQAYIDVLEKQGESIPRTLSNAVKTLEK